MKRRTFIASMGMASAGLALTPDEVLPPDLIPSRQAGAVLAHGRVLEVGVGRGAAMRIIQTSTRVSEYVGLDIDPDVTGPGVITGNVFDLADSLDKFDCVYWDAEPLTIPGRKKPDTTAWWHTPEAPAMIASLLVPGGTSITFGYGEPHPDHPLFDKSFNVTFRNSNGHPYLIYVHKRK